MNKKQGPKSRHRSSASALTVPSLPEAMEISRFSNLECPRMHRVSDSAGPVEGSLANVCIQGCLPLRTTGSASRMGDFGAPWLACARPCQLLHVQPRGYPHITRGHNGTASPVMWGSFIPNSMPVYPGAFGPIPSETTSGDRKDDRPSGLRRNRRAYKPPGLLFAGPEHFPGSS
jgi:hypothetical protein